MRALLALLAGCGIAAAQVSPAPSAESTFIPRPTLNLATYNATEPAQSGTVALVDSFGAIGDGITDDTAAINAAIASLPGGGTVVFTSGKTYRKTDLITVSTASVVLWGYGATIFADDSLNPSAPNLAFELAGAHDAAYGLTIITNLRTRPVNTSSAALWIAADDVQAIDDRFEYTGTGIYNAGTHTFIGRNVAYRTQADSIHTPSHGDIAVDHALIVGNVVWQNGDDGISVVNYELANTDPPGEAPTITDILIEGNVVAGNYWGNGITVVGGKNITIRNNTINGVAYLSAVKVESNGSFNTRDVSNILVSGNTATDIQTLSPAYNPIAGQHTAVAHGVYYTQASAGHTVDHVLFTGNTATRAVQQADHAQFSGTVTNIGFAMTRMSGIQTVPQISIPAGIASSAWCSDNQVVDQAGIVAANCSGAQPTVTGSSYTSR